MIATIVKHQWFSGSPLPLNEWFGRNHWYQWFFNGFWSINHWPRCFFSLATIGLDGFAMVFGLATIGLDGFSMVANHWSNDGMVTIHRSGLQLMIRPKTTSGDVRGIFGRHPASIFCRWKSKNTFELSAGPHFIWIG